MKTLLLTILTLSLAVTAFAGDAWFDLENCGMCKNLMNDPELFSAMTWNNYEVKHGLMEVTTYPAEMKDRFGELMATMEATGAKMMQGEQVPMCGMCMSYGSLMMAGADVEQVETEAGQVTLITSRDADTVAKIHKHVRTTIKEYAAMMAAEEHGAHGHDHGHGHEHAH